MHFCKQYLRGDNILKVILGKIKVGTTIFVDRYKNVIYDDNEYLPTLPPTTATTPPTSTTIKTTVPTASTSSQP